MQGQFTVEILTPVKRLVKTQATEVVLPAHDGERGVLSSHENFVGLLGTGVLKIVSNGDDFWFAVSKGGYEIADGNLCVFTHQGESADDLDVERASAKVAELEEALAKQSAYEEDFDVRSLELKRMQSFVEVHRRTSVVN